jgi:hypothetical protein
MKRSWSMVQRYSKPLLSLILGALLGLNFAYANGQSTAPITETIDIDTHAPAHDFPISGKKCLVRDARS